MAEGVVLKACLQYLHSIGCSVIRNQTGSAYRKSTDKRGQTREWYIQFGKKGSGDIVACSPSGRWIEVETKAGKNKQQPEQLAREQEIRRRGGVYIVAYSVDDLIARKDEILAEPRWS